MSDPNYFALLEACVQLGCPVCRLVHNSVAHFLDGLFYEMVNDAGMRQQLRGSLGFCRAHVRLLLDTQLRDPLGLTIIYHDLLGQVLDNLPEANLLTENSNPLETLFGRRLKGLSSQVESSLQALSPEEICPACRQQEQYARSTIQSLLENLQDEALCKALEASSGLCLPHLRLALENGQSVEQFNSLISVSQQQLQALRQELAEFIRKNDYRFSKEDCGPEGNAYRRAMELFVGSE